MKDIANFIASFRRFQEKYFSADRELFYQLRQGQRPKAAISACADSRVDPAQVTDVMQLDAELLDVSDEAGRAMASVRFSGQIREEATAVPCRRRVPRQR